MADILQIKVIQDKQTTIMAVTGDISMAAVDEFELEVNKIASKNPKLAVFDMRNVSFISSLAMGTLVSLHHTMKRTSGGKIVLAGLQPMIRRAFETAKLDQLIGLADSVEDAIKKYDV